MSLRGPATVFACWFALGYAPCANDVQATPVDPYFTAGADGTIMAIAVQQDGKIVVGGYFGSLGNGPAPYPTVRGYIGRFTAKGIVDPAFNPGANARVVALAIQPDGKILVGGDFWALGAGGTTPCLHLGRLNVDGSVDATFNAEADLGVLSILVQPDGKIIVGGLFTTLDGATRNHLGRLNSDGSLDTSFLDVGVNAPVEALALQPDGKVLVGGNITLMGGQARLGLGRLNADGTLDQNFNPGVAFDCHPNGDGCGWTAGVLSLVVQPDNGKTEIVVGGFFEELGGGTGTTPRKNIGRVDEDGAVDPLFNPGAEAVLGAPAVWALALQPDGKILVGGHFFGLGGAPRADIGRLHTDGSVDLAFDPQADNDVIKIALQADGGVLLAGGFTKLGGAVHRNLGRATNAAATHGFTDDPLIAKVTVVRALHITELRDRIDAVRAAHGLPAYSWTDPVLSAGATVIRAQHILDLRAALRQVYVALGFAVPIYADQNLAAGTLVTAIHIQQLRYAIFAIE